MNLCIHRLGTHVLENKIGTIRSLSFQNESAKKIISIAARHDFIKTLTKSNDEIKRTRLNQGGVRLNLGETNIGFGASAESISMLLLSELNFIDQFPSDIDIPTFSENLENFVKKCPYVLNISFSSTKSSKIVDRYYSLPKSFDFIPVVTTKHIWTLEESQIVDNCLYHGTENQLHLILPYIPIQNINAYVSKRKTEFANRPITSYELYLFNLLQREKIKIKDIALMLPCRTAQSLKKLLNL